ncbi:hypothetical protein AAON49_12740 [Pseudotenacibaculum sp. MALMAid0570]|uniref:hypothetical protein n=1 Tax=Pseudotenacibaculum sp. MALMAid0570 TaxID=3143938 RepID=UPI0032DF07E8
MKKNIILTFLTLTLGFSLCYSQRKELDKVNIEKFIEETQFSNDQTEGIEMIWWMPSEYWEVVFSKDKYTSSEETKIIVEMLKKHVLVIAIKGKVGMFGGVTYESRENILKGLKVFYNGSGLKHIPQDNLDPDLKNFITLIGPMMKNMMGQMGENMQVFVFKNDKKNPINVWEKGKIDFGLNDFKVTMDLPISSLLLEKKCPEGKKLFSGKWSYCPFHGKELESQEN